MIQRFCFILAVCSSALVPILSCFGQLPIPTPTPTPSPNPCSDCPSDQDPAQRLAQLIGTIPATRPNLAIAAITYPNGKGWVVSRCLQGIFDLVAVQPGQAVDVVVQYPIAQALQVVLIEPIDGGQVTMQQGASTISATGLVKFTFTAGTEPGLYQVSLRQGVQELGLQFWVSDPEDPTNSPPALDPATNPVN